MSYKKLLTMTAVAAAVGWAAKSEAASSPQFPYGSETVTVFVKLADLNLGSPAGAAVGLRRIHHAATEICGPEPDIADLGMAHVYRACVEDAVGRAVDRLAKPIVSALNGGRPSAVMAANVR